MKLATYQDGSRDGQLVVVSRDLSQAHFASGIASHLRQVLDDWNFLAPQLHDLYDQLNAGRVRHAFAFDAAQCLAPLPRATQWARAAAYAAPGAPAPRDAALQQSAGDSLMGACSELIAASEAQDMDFEAGLAAITGDVRRGVSPEQALESVRLLMLVNDACLRALLPGDAARAGAAFSPVAATPDELGDAWTQGRVHLTLQVRCNGRSVGLCDSGPDMALHFGDLIAQLARTRPVRAGAIVGSGPVANAAQSTPGGPAWPKGYASIAHKRAMEALQGDGAAATAFLRWGDTIRIDMKGRNGHSVFGAIEQTVAPLAA